MTKFTLIISSLLIAQLASAQITFQKTFGGTAFTEEGTSVHQNFDGGYIIAGKTTSFGAGNTDIYLIRTNVYGDTLWTKTFGGTSYDFGYSVQQTTDGGFIVAGAAFGSNPNYKDAILIRTDANGDTLWTKSFEQAGHYSQPSVQQTTDGGFIMTGAQGDVYLIKTDINGDTLWTKTFGGATLDYGAAVQQTTDGGYIVVGSTYSFGWGNNDVYLIKTNANGDTMWTKTFCGSNSEYGNSVKQTSDGGYIITGYTDDLTGTSSRNVYLIKTDTNGTLLWSKTYGGSDYDIGNSVQQTSDGGYIIAGNTSSFGLSSNNAYLVKTDSIGNLLWSKTFGGTGIEYGNSVQQTTDDGYILTGQTMSFGAGGMEVYLIKTDSNGNSGCNETNPATNIYQFTTQTTSPATLLSSGFTNFNSTFIIGSGSIVNTLCSTVGINENILNNSINISPNPSKGNFVISFEEVIMKGNVEILNILGENVFKKNIFNESKKEIDVKNISQGIYFVKVFDGEKSYCKKLIVEHD